MTTKMDSLASIDFDTFFKTSYQKFSWKQLTCGFVPLTKLKEWNTRIILVFSTFESVVGWLSNVDLRGDPAVKSA